jgi:hypothetical protein
MGKGISVTLEGKKYLFSQEEGAHSKNKNS